MMERSASKRRKLSPSLAAPSPANTSRRTTRDGSSRPGQRASFSSPTKASLSRFNPELLPPSRPIAPPKSAGRKSPNVRTRILNVNNEGSALPRGRSISNGAGTNSVAGKSNDGLDDGNRAPASRNHLSASPRRRSKTPTTRHSLSKMPQTQPAPTLRPLSSQSTNIASQSDRTNLTDLRAPSAREHRVPNGVAIDASDMENLPHTPTRHGAPSGANRIRGAGPSLPSTPSQLGLATPSEKSRGLLFTKPDKENEQRKDGTLPTTSDKAPPMRTSVEHPQTSMLGPKIFLPGLPKPAPTLQQTQLQKKITSRTQIENDTIKTGADYLKDVLLSSWQSPGGKETTSQQRQRKKIMESSSRLVRLGEEIDQLRIEIGEINDALRVQAVNIDAANLSKSSTSISLSLSQQLSQFFPFSQISDATPSAATLSSMAQDVGETVQISNSKLINDHEHNVETILQKHDAEFLSNGSVLVALQITIDTNHMAVHDLKLLERGLSSSQELQTWIQDKAYSREVASIGTAVNRCSYVVERRAACRRTCYERHADLAKPSLDDSSSLSKNQETITFQRQSLSLSITWAIRLREDGEAESRLSIAVDLPPAWVDEGIVSGNGSEGQNVREAFDLLVRERGVTEATSVVVKLLFQSESD